MKVLIINLTKEVKRSTQKYKSLIKEKQTRQKEMERYNMFIRVDIMKM